MGWTKTLLKRIFTCGLVFLYFFMLNFVHCVGYIFKQYGQCVCKPTGVEYNAFSWI